MPKSASRETVRQIQQIISKETGGRLGPQAAAEIEAVLQRALSGGGAGESGFLSRDVTILLADLRGFTAIASAYPGGTVIALLNRCLARMSEVIFRYHGTIDKFMGDSIMVLFGGSGSGSGDEEVRNALACAVAMQRGMEELNREHKEQGMPEFYLGIGINTGTVMAGTIGSELYSEYTVIGDNVNLASRIEAFSLRGQVLISPSTYERCQDFVQTGDPVDVHVKGKPKPVSLREVLAIPSLGIEVPRKEVRRSPRVEVKIPFAYRLIENKVIVPESHRGLVLDIGYHGMLATLNHELPLYSEIELEMDLPLVGYKTRDISARVVKSKKEKKHFICGIEFTSISAECNKNIQLFVQLLIQGAENR